MKKNSQTSQEILEPEVEEILTEIPLDKQIETALVKENITDKVIRQLKETFGGMSLKSIDDKEGYLDIKKGRNEVRRIGILVEKVCKKGREDAVAIQRKWLNKEKEVLAKIAEVQDPLDAEIKKFEDEVERKENEEKIKREEAFIARQSSLLKYGAEYRNGSYELNELSYEAELIKNADSEMWDEVILPKYKRVYEQKEAARVEEETKRREEMERQEKERKDLEEKQQAFRKEQEEFERQKLELQEQKDKQEREIREAEEKRYHEELQKRISIRNGRVSELKNLGCRYDEQDGLYLYGSFAAVSVAELEALSEQDWTALLLDVKPKIEKIKADEEGIRIARIAKEKQEAAELAAKNERERIAEEQRLNELKKKQEQEQKELELAQSSDKVKWEAFLVIIKAISHSEMKSPSYKKKQAIAKEKLEEIINL